MYICYSENDILTLYGKGFEKALPECQAVAYDTTDNNIFMLDINGTEVIKMDTRDFSTEILTLIPGIIKIEVTMARRLIMHYKDAIKYIDYCSTYSCVHTEPRPEQSGTDMAPFVFADKIINGHKVEYVNGKTVIQPPDSNRTYEIQGAVQTEQIESDANIVIVWDIDGSAFICGSDVERVANFTGYLHPKAPTKSARKV